MIKNWLSRYGWHYPRSLVYMLQATEYHLADYFSWYHKTKNFNQVEKRKHLVKTPKAKTLLALAWLITTTLYAFSFYLLSTKTFPLNLVLFFVSILLTPHLLAYLMAILLLLIDILFAKPIAYFKVKKACEKLAKHQGIKIAIAGSFGKTTMREILKTTIAAGKKVAAPPNSFNTPLGISKFIDQLNGDEEILIFELGEYYPGDVARLCRLIKPDIGIITGVNEAHLHRFKNLKRSTDTIFEITKFVDAKNIYVNSENKLAKDRAANNYQTYNKNGIGGYEIENPQSDLGGTKFILKTTGQSLEIYSKILGLHQLGSLALAAKIGSDLGLTTDEIKNGLNHTKAFDHRLEPKIDPSGVITLDDSYNGNPDGVNAVIEFLASLKDHRRFYVTPGLVEMGARSKAVHLAIGHKLAEAKIEKVVLIKNSVTQYVAQGLKDAGYQGEVLWFDDALSAYASLPLLTLKGDVVLLQNDWPDQYQ